MVEDVDNCYTFEDFKRDCDSVTDRVNMYMTDTNVTKSEIFEAIGRMKRWVEPWAKTHFCMERTLDQILNGKKDGYSYGKEKTIFSSTLPSDSFYAKTCEMAKEASQYGMPESITINFKTPNKQGVSYSKDAIADIESKLKGDENKS